MSTYIENIPHSRKLNPVNGQEFVKDLIGTYGESTNRAFSNILQSKDKSVKVYANYLAEQIAGGKTLNQEDQRYLADYVKRVSLMR